MAHKHELAILKSSASYFCRYDIREEKEGLQLSFSPLVCEGEEGKIKNGVLKEWVLSDELSQTNK